MINTNGSIFGLVVSIIVAVINLLFGLFEIALILTVISSWIRKLKGVCHTGAIRTSLKPII